MGRHGAKPITMFFRALIIRARKRCSTFETLIRMFDVREADSVQPFCNSSFAQVIIYGQSDLFLIFLPYVTSYLL